MRNAQRLSLTYFVSRGTNLQPVTSESVETLCYTKTGWDQSRIPER